MKSGNLDFLEPSGPLQACNGTLPFKNFLDKISKNNQISNYMKARSVEAEFFHANCRGRTDMTKLTVAFRYFANVPKNWFN